MHKLSPGVPILLCTALRIEAAACHWGLVRSGVGSRFEILLTGMGAELARNSLLRRLSDHRRPRPGRIISTGFAGSNVPQLVPGDWILAKRVGNSALLDEAFANRLEARLPLRRVSISVPEDYLSARYSVGTPKTEAVDLESSALASVSEDEGIPFHVLRLISDSPAMPLPEAIRKFSTSDPREIPSGLHALLREPLQTFAYVLKASRLPVRLSDGWKSAGQALADPEFLES